MRIVDFCVVAFADAGLQQRIFAFAVWAAGDRSGLGRVQKALVGPRTDWRGQMPQWKSVFGATECSFEVCCSSACPQKGSFYVVSACGYGHGKRKRCLSPAFAGSQICVRKAYY